MPPPPRSVALTALAVLLALLAFAVRRSSRAADEAPFPEFRTQEIERGLGVGYAVLLVDVNDDGKKDIVVVDQKRVVWYENPGWKRRTIIEGQTKPDNVCLAAADVDGDGKVDFALGAGWRPPDTRTEAPLYWLRRGKALDEPWQLTEIGGEPSVHRIRFADVDGDDRPELLIVPLQGRGSSAAKNWMDGSPVRILALKVPKDPAKDRWAPEVVDDGLRVIHNFVPVPAAGGKGSDVLTASYDGVHLLRREGGKWARTHLGTGNQDNPNGSRGASEIKQGHPAKGRPCIATIEPWHGNQVVAYTPADGPAKKLWDRHVVDDRLKWGHAVSFADLDGDGGEELIVGVRDDLSQKPGERRGVRVYRAADGKGAKWQRHFVDPGGVAVEDLAADDLDGDGKVDIVAVGRQTHNVRIYWNKGKR